MNRCRRVLLATVAVAAALSEAALGQGTGHETNALGWFIYSGDHPVRGRWGIHLDAQFRRDEVAVRPQQLLLRPAVAVDLTRRFSAAFGYAYSKVYPYGETPDPFAYPEHRIYEEFTAKHKARGWDVSHRIRVEQRFIAQAGTVPASEDTSWRYGNRFRYQLQGQHPLSRSTYIRASLEPQVRFGLRYRGRAFDQQQTYVGLGRAMSDKWDVEVGYSYQTGVPRRGRIYEHNHIVEFTIRSSASLANLIRVR